MEIAGGEDILFKRESNWNQHIEGALDIMYERNLPNIFRKIDLGYQ